jgi:hypothetical protein
LRLDYSIRTKLARRVDVEGAGALVFALALRQRCTAMPADSCRHRKRLVGGVAALVIAREIDDVAGRRYEFLNYCKSSRLETALSQKGFAQTFSATLKF